ncbi:hypothetical protein GCM10009526_30880 [Glutamicibacter creatinolyticus]
MGSRGPSLSATPARRPGTVRALARRLGAEDSGQSLVLVIGLVAITLLTISIVLAASAVNLKARQLLAAADGAVIAAVDEFELVGEGPKPEIRLNEQQVSQAVRRYLADTQAHGRFDDLGVGGVGILPDGQGATVQLTARVTPPIVGWLVPAGIPIHVDATARTVLSR